MKGWDEKIGTPGRVITLLLAIVFLILGGIYLVDVIQTGSFNIQSTDRLTITFLLCGIALVIVAARGKLFQIISNC